MFNTNAYGVVELSKHTFFFHVTTPFKDATDPVDHPTPDVTLHIGHLMRYVHPKKTHEYPVCYASIPSDWFRLLTKSDRRALDVTYFGIQGPALHIPSSFEGLGVETTYWVGWDWMDVPQAEFPSLNAQRQFLQERMERLARLYDARVAEYWSTF